jgi:transposase
VAKWRARFIALRLEGLIDKPRPGAPHKLGDAEIERLVAIALSGAPFAEGGHWSSRALAAHLGVSQSTVSRALRATGVTAHAGDALRLATGKVRGIVGLYVSGPLHAIALCVEDKRQASTPEPPERWPLTTPLLPPRRSLTCPRYGDATLFEALDLAASSDAGHGARGGSVRPFLAFLRALDVSLPTERAVLVAIEDRGRNQPTVAQWFARKPRFRLQVAPSRAAWLAQVERWFALLGGRSSSAPGGDRATASLERAAREYLDRTPRTSEPFLWIKEDGEPAAGSDP